MVRWFLISVSCLCGCVSAPPAPVNGWIEATAIVRDLQSAAEFFETTAGYRRIHRGITPAPVIAAWGLPESASGREIVLAEPGQQRGFVRLVQLSNVGVQIEARSAGQFFDTGGVFGLNVRVVDIELAFRRMQSAGWRPLSDPVRFSVEEFAVAEAVFRGPDGLVIGLIERERPVLGPQWSMARGQLSRPNNAFVVARRLDASLDFYVDVLAWSSFLRDTGTAASAGMNLYGWPHDLVEDISREVVWVHPDGGGEGSIAIMQLGVTGRDFRQSVTPPNYGWTSLRVWARGTDKLGGKTAGAFKLAPYGCVDMLSSLDPENVRLEFLRPSDEC